MRRNVYARAAKLVEDGRVNFACVALSRVLTNDAYSFASGRPQLPAELKFRAYFAPNPEIAATVSFPWWPRVDRKAQNARVLALCFAAAMREAGDL